MGHAVTIYVVSGGASEVGAIDVLKMTTSPEVALGFFHLNTNSTYINAEDPIAAFWQAFKNDLFTDYPFGIPVIHKIRMDKNNVLSTSRMERVLSAKELI